MGIKYGYCDEYTTVSWKIDHSNGYVGVNLWGIQNVILVRTRVEIIPFWYKLSKGRYIELATWVDSLLCDDTQIPSSASLSVQINSIYRWKPKDASPKKGDVINYNEPCTNGQDSRKALRSYLSGTVQGIGAFANDKFGNTLTHFAKTAMENTFGIILPDGIHWVPASCSSNRPVNSWHSYNLGWQAVIPPLCQLPEWTMMSLTVDNLQDVELSTLTITEVVYFPDKHATEVNYEGVINILKTRAGVDSCPTV